MEDEPYTVCPACGEVVDPTDPTVEYAFVQVPVPTMGDPHAVIDGIGAYFHAGHLPHDSQSWRPAAKPS